MVVDRELWLWQNPEIARPSYLAPSTLLRGRQVAEIRVISGQARQPQFRGFREQGGHGLKSRPSSLVFLCVGPSRVGGVEQPRHKRGVGDAARTLLLVFVGKMLDSAHQ